MKPEYKQHGATLITALVMLVVLTLLVISAIQSSSVNLRVAGNMQIQQENVHAAQQASETYISNDFTQNPATSNVAVTINGQTYKAVVATPYCFGTRTLSVNEPMTPQACRKRNKADPNDPNQTDCAVQQWDVATTVTDPTTNMPTTVHQGMSSIVPISTQCKGTTITF